MYFTGEIEVRLPHGNILRYAIDCNGVQIDVDVLFKKARLFPDGAKVYLAMKKEDCIEL